jgi:hypothetical protein
MIYVTWPPGCYGHYVMQSIYAYSNLSNGAELKIESNGSSHGFDATPYFCSDHRLDKTANVIIAPSPGHQLDYLNNQLVKQANNNIMESLQNNFPNFIENLCKWNTITNSEFVIITKPWAIREYISFWLVDNMKESYPNIDGHITALDLFNKNVFPNLINRLGLTLVADTATMNSNQRNWIAQQRYHNSQHRCNAWLLDILEDRNAESPCQTLLDEAYVQHCLREQGYEIRCNGLDMFPTNSKDLRELIYENSNTSNKR